jgi:hypothetical protein
MMNNEQQLAKITLELLKRVDLKGEEVPAYVQVVNWLDTIANPKNIDQEEKSDD